MSETKVRNQRNADDPAVPRSEALHLPPDRRHPPRVGRLRAADHLVESPAPRGIRRPKHSHCLDRRFGRLRHLLPSPLIAALPLESFLDHSVDSSPSAIYLATNAILFDFELCWGRGVTLYLVTSVQRELRIGHMNCVRSSIGADASVSRKFAFKLNNGFQPHLGYASMSVTLVTRPIRASLQKTQRSPSVALHPFTSNVSSHFKTLKNKSFVPDSAHPYMSKSLTRWVLLPVSRCCEFTSASARRTAERFCRRFDQSDEGAGITSRTVPQSNAY